jgi:hypothetical protein
MAETYFNTQDGRLYIGQAAIAAGMEQPFSELVPLKDLLLDPNFLLPERYERLSGSGWKHEDYEALGHWTLELLFASDPNPDAGRPKLSYEYFDRLNQLGIAPHPDYIAGEFDSFQNFCENIGAINEHRGNKFIHWTLNDYVNYAKQVASELGRKPIKKDYQSRYLQGLGPSGNIISKHVGNNRLNDLIGYPDIRSWDDDDYLRWGARVLMVNGNVKFTAPYINYFSRIKRGPSEAAVRVRFGSATKFRQRAEEEMKEIIREQEQQDNILFAEHDALQEAGKLVLAEELEPQVRLRTTAQYLVVTRLLPQLGNDLKVAIAQYTPERFVATIQQKNIKLTAGHIETTAVSLDVFDYIWPMDEWREYLKVNVDELDSKRKSLSDQVTSAA